MVVDVAPAALVHVVEVVAKLGGRPPPLQSGLRLHVEADIVQGPVCRGRKLRLVSLASTSEQLLGQDLLLEGELVPGLLQEVLGEGGLEHGHSGHPLVTNSLLLSRQK